MYWCVLVSLFFSVVNPIVWCFVDAGVNNNAYKLSVLCVETIFLDQKLVRVGRLSQFKTRSITDCVCVCVYALR